MSTCRSCGRDILWAETQHGKKVPLDTKALVFSVVQDGMKFIAVKPTGGVIGERFLVSHFATCPEANAWSGHKRGDPGPPPDKPHNMTSDELPQRHFSEPKE